MLRLKNGLGMTKVIVNAGVEAGPPGRLGSEGRLPSRGFGGFVQCLHLGRLLPRPVAVRQSTIE